MTKHKVPRMVINAARNSEYVFVAAPVSSKTPGLCDLEPVPEDLYVRYLGTRLVDVAVPPADNTRGLAAIVGRVGGEPNTPAEGLDVQVNCHVWLLSTVSMFTVMVEHLNWKRLYWVKEPEAAKPPA